MAIYGYRCPHCSDIEVAFPIGTATAAVPCPDCGATSTRVFSHPCWRALRPPCRPSCSARSAAPPSPRSSPPCRRAAAGRGGRPSRHPTPAAPVTVPALKGVQPCPSSSSRSTRPRSSPTRSQSATTAGTPTSRRWPTVKPGDSFRVHCREWFDGAIHNDDSADDVRDAPLPTVHVLSGPIAVEGAEPGDLLIVDILDVGPDPAGGLRPAGRPGLGLHRHLRHPERRRLPHRAVPRRLQGDLGLPRSGMATSRHVPACRSPASSTPA